MEQMLNGFQTDLSSISSEIQTLQQQSVAMNQRLKNRQAVRGELSQFVDEMVIPDSMITSVSFSAIVDSLHKLSSLNNFEKHLKSGLFKLPLAQHDTLM